MVVTAAEFGPNAHLENATHFNANILMYTDKYVPSQQLSTPYCLADQLEWFSEIASQNPAMMSELEKEGRLAHGLITADFETNMKESKAMKKIMKRDDAPDMIGIGYHESATTKKAKVTLLVLEDGTPIDKP